VFLHCRTIYSNALERGLYVAFARLPNVRRIVAVSSASAQNFRTVADKVRVVRNGVPIDEVVERAGEDDVRQRFGITADAPLIGFVGRFVGWKGVDVFLAAAEIVTRRHPDARFMLVGDVPVGSSETLEDYRARGGSRDLGCQLVFAGFQSNPAPYLQAFDALVVPSVRPDPCPRVVVESMALGTLVIGSDAGGIPEVVRHEVNGLLVPPGDADALAEEIGRALADPELRGRLASAGAHEAREHYDAVHVAARVQAIIAEAMAPASMGA
jgi:glycosyltransferase involved in cell wall biosynthesis